MTEHGNLKNTVVVCLTGMLIYPIPKATGEMYLNYQVIQVIDESSEREPVAF